MDTAKLAAALIVLLGGIVAYYWFADLSVLLRVPGLVLSVAAAILIAFQSSQGKAIWQFIQSSQIEIRKVVWPTQQETINTTMIVLVFTILLGLFFLLIDWILLEITQFLTGQGG
jgi:preprotein translocase subunit SecE